MCACNDSVRVCVCTRGVHVGVRVFVRAFALCITVRTRIIGRLNNWPQADQPAHQTGLWIGLVFHNDQSNYF